MSSDSSDNRRKSWLGILSPSRRWLRVLLALIGLLLLAFLGVLGYYAMRAQHYDLGAVGHRPSPGMLFDSRNRPISKLDAGEVDYVPWEQFPRYLVDAFVAREDEKFFSHSGVVLSSVVRSMLRNILSMRYEQGASTITMQLTRNVYELQGKSMDRKLLEAALAQRIERHYDKQTIFAQYLNRIYYGQDCYGIGAAARHYFNKEVSALNLSECATLAGLVRAPSLCNPETSIENATGVRNETLARMLELEMISQQEYDAVLATPIKLNINRTKLVASYISMESQHEMETLRDELKDAGGGLSVVTSIDLEMQRYAEEACEMALAAVENPGRFPAPWRAQYETEQQADAAAEDFGKLRRPDSLKPRGSSNNLTDLLQCCVLVIDSRSGHKGELITVTCGRSALDERNRWDAEILPGRAWAPLVYCTACLPGGEERHIVARDARVTGRRIGYDVVRSFVEELKISESFPDREHADDLYEGLFPMPRRNLARLLYSILNQGKGYELHCIRSVWSRGGRCLHSNRDAAAAEYIRRESAVSVAALPPFTSPDGRITELSVTLPDGYGQWSMVSNERGVCVFVWMGFDDPRQPAAQDNKIQPLLRQASRNLARELHGEARRILREQMAREKEKEEQASAQES